MTWNACCGDLAYAANATCAAITPQQFGTTVPSTTPYYFATTSRLNIQFTTRDKRQAEIVALQWRGDNGLEANPDVQVSDYEFTEQRRGGTDESTYGPRFAMAGAEVTDSGPVRLSGVQEAVVTGNRFTRAKGLEVTHSVGEPRTIITGNRFTATPAPIVRELMYTGAPRTTVADNRVLP